MDLTPDLLLRAYGAGVFPMAEARETTKIHWVDPQRRAIIPLDGFHVSHNLARRIRRLQPHITLDRDFAGVVRACADRPKTWINTTIFNAYTALHQLGHAHSVEVWHQGRLIGGTYGVVLGAAYFGESMFSRATDGSKIALASLVQHLRDQSFQLFDVQFMTPHLASLGAVEISRAAYHRKLAAAVAVAARFR